MSSFFTAPGAQKKRKRTTPGDVPKKRAQTASKSSAKPSSKTVAPKKSAVRDDESISGSDSDEPFEDVGDGVSQSGSESEGEGETAGDKRLRLAESYLQGVRKEAELEVGFNAEDVDRDIIAQRLKDDVAESKGRVYRVIADELACAVASHSLFRCNTLATTSVATCAPFAYTAHKGSVLIKWKLQDLPAHQYPQTTKKKPSRQAPPRRQPIKVAMRKGDKTKAKDRDYQGHTGDIICVAASEDGKYVVTGGEDHRIVVHDAKTLRPLKAFTHHRDAVTGLAFRRGTNQMYSASKDRTIKVWSLEAGPPFAYVETLFGHADEVVDIAALAQERCVTVGSRDRTARLWKVVEESQLVFRGGGGEKKPKGSNIDPKSLALENSMDRVAMLDDDLFVTGSQNGSISLWSLTKKKPLFSVPRAHGLEPPLRPEEASAEQTPDPKVVPPEQPRWITALRTLPYSDVVLSGSWDGHVRLWKLSDDKRRIEPVGALGQPPAVVSSPELNGVPVGESQGEVEANRTSHNSQATWSIKGVVNDLALFERGEKGKDGLCVVAAVGKEHRLGRWKKISGGRNGAIVFEIPREKATSNGGGCQGHRDGALNQQEA